jgi:hypothetical protein
MFSATDPEEGGRSGNPFARHAPSLIANGYSPIPIMPGGKAPGMMTGGEWILFKGWNKFCVEQTSRFQVDLWSKWPNAGLGVACGFNGLIAVDVDFEPALSAIMEILPGALVAKVGKKGRTFFYRGDCTVIRSRNYRTPGRVGLLDLLAHGKQTVLPPTLHPETGREYEWFSDLPLWEIPLDELTELTPAHVAAIEDVLRRYGWDPEHRDDSTTKPRAPKAAPAGGADKPAVVRGAANRWRRINDAAFAYIERWAPVLNLPKGRFFGRTYRAVAPWRPSSTGKSEAKRNRNLSISPNGAKDHGTGETFTAIDLVVRALNKTPFEAALWLCERLGLDWAAMEAEDRAAEPEPDVPPTYPDRTVSPAEGRALIANALDRYFGEQLPAERKARQELVNDVVTHHLAERWIPHALASHALRQWRPEAWLIKVEAGAGKTTQVFPHIVAAVRADLRVVVSVKSLRLAEANIVPGLARLGITARAYRGVSQPDPWCAGHKMCRDQPARAAAAAVGASSKDVCGTADSAVRCKHFDVCGVNRQRAEQPDVWVITHGMAFTAWQDFLPKPDLLIFDESFIDAAMGESVTIPLSALLTNTTVRGANGAVDEAQTSELQKRRAALYAALSATPDGYVAPEPLAADLSPIAARQANGAEWSRRPAVDLRPGMAPDALDAVVADHKDAYQFVRAMSEVWAEVARVLETGGASGSLVLRTTPADERQLVICPLARLSEGLRDASILVLDATPPTVERLQNALDCPVRVALDQPIARSPNSTLIQVINAPVSAKALGITKRPAADDARAAADVRNVEYVHNLVSFLAGLWPKKGAAVFPQEGLETKLNARGLPANVRTGHFNAVDGLNDYQDVAVVACIGRTLPGVREVEAEAAVTFCAPVSAVQADDHGRTRYTRERAYIRLTNGGNHPVDVLRHPDPRAEAVRQQKCEAPVVQALARGRALNRREATPLLSVLVADLCLDITVDAVVHWGDLRPIWRVPAAVWQAGVLLGNWRDGERAYPGLSERDAKHVAEVAGAFEGAEVGDKLLTKNLSKGFVPNLPHRGRIVRYQRTGAGQRPCLAVITPIGPQRPAEIRAWLETRLGCELAKLEIGRMAPDPSIFAAAWETAQPIIANLEAAGRLPPWQTGLAAFVTDDASALA